MASVVIKKEELPAVNTGTKSYLIRYRIISNDKNRASYWSPIFEVSSAPIFTSQTITGKTQFDLVTIAWPRLEKPIDPNKKYLAVMPEYDVWIAWDSILDADFEYVGRTTNTSIVIAKKTGSTHVSVKVYLSSSIISIGTETAAFKYAELDNINT